MIARGCFKNAPALRGGLSGVRAAVRNRLRVTIDERRKEVSLEDR